MSLTIDDLFGRASLLTAGVVVTHKDDADPLRGIDPTGEAGLLGPTVGVGVTVYGLSKMFSQQNSCEIMCDLTQGDAVKACGDPDRQSVLDAQKNPRVLACKAQCAMGSIFSRLLPGKLK